MPPRGSTPDNPVVTMELPPLPEAHIPVGGRLRHFADKWLPITDDQWLLSVVRHGYRLEFIRPPPLSNDPRAFAGRRMQGKREELQIAVDSLLAKGAIRRVDLEQAGPGFYNHFFLVPKKSGGWRPILNLTALNRYIRTSSFRMETPRRVLAAVSPDEWLVSIDLKDAYFHIAIHESCYRYLRFMVGNRVYEYTALPFGLATAPAVFTRVMLAPVAFLHRQSVRLHPYLDDWLIRHHNRIVLLSHAQRAWRLIATIGLIPSTEKSCMIPSQDMVFVGIRFITRLGIVCPTQERVDKLLAITQMVWSSTCVPARAILVLLGGMTSMIDIVPWARLRQRPVQLYLLAHWRAHRHPLDHPIPVKPALRYHLRWWQEESNLLAGMRLASSQPDSVLFTDASHIGWGAHLDNWQAAGLWGPQDKTRHINWLELQAVFLALKKFERHVIAHHILVNTDNTTVVAYINKMGGTRSPSLCYLLWDLMMWCKERSIELRARHLPGKRNHIADALSRNRQVRATEWAIPQQVADLVFRKWGFPTLDLFATFENRKLPLFVSPVVDHRAVAMDALSIPWRGLVGYAFPPLPLLPLVLRKIREEDMIMILIAPLWPSRSWFPVLLELLVERPLELPLREDLLSQGKSLVHPDPSVFHLHAFKLSNKPSLRKAFLSQLPRSSPDLNDPARWLHTRTNGENSWIGVTEDRSIQSQSLVPN